MVNSSINFIIYCAVGSRFRQALAARIFGSNGGPVGFITTNAHSRAHAHEIHNHHHRPLVQNHVQVEARKDDVLEEEDVEAAAVEAKALIEAKTIQTLTGIYGHNPKNTRILKTYSSKMTDL